MTFVGTASVTDLLILIGSALGSAFLTVVGVIVEYTALQNLLAEQLVLGAWEAGMGVLVLIGGLYLLGYETAWPRLRHLRHAR